MWSFKEPRQGGVLQRSHRPARPDGCVILPGQMECAVNDQPGQLIRNRYPVGSRLRPHPIHINIDLTLKGFRAIEGEGNDIRCTPLPQIVPVETATIMVVNEYDARLDSYPGNPLGRRRAFVGRSRGYIATKLDLSDLADQNVRFRFRIGTSGLGVPFAGWFIDDFRIYTCSNPDPLSMTLTYPSEGQILKPGEYETITWTGPSEMAYATLRYSLDKGATWKTIEKNHTGTDYYWEVPLQQNNKKGIMKVTGYNSKGESLESSSVPFSIEVVRLIYPNGGDTLTSGDNKNITWTTNTTKAAIAKVLLFYTKNGGTTWKEIDPTVVKTNAGSYDWTVPDVGETLKTKCKAKVVLRDAANNVIGSDVSDSTFTIQPPLP